MNDKRYYWLKLEENYFDLKVQKALRKLPSGAEMLICYLKMQLRYLNTGGIIEFNNICNSIAEEIALDIDEEEDLVKMTLAILTKWNVIETEENSLYISEMQERIGSKTDVALRVAKHREKQKMLHCNTDVTKCNYIKEIDIEKEKDKEIEIETPSSNPIYEWFSSRNFSLNPKDYEIINQILEYDERDIDKALNIAIDRQTYKPSYILGILKKGNIDYNKKKEIKPHWLDMDLSPKKKEGLTDEQQEFVNELYKIAETYKSED